MLLNAENLFLLSDQTLSLDHLKLDQIQWNKLSTSVYENKPLEKAKALGRVIQSENPDLILLCEVGGLESLQNFNRLFLNDQYSPALIEGNSDRNIDVGFLIRKNMGFYFDIITNKNRPINYLYPHERQSVEAGYPVKKVVSGSHRFSRDVAELHFFQKDREKPFLIFLLTHLKSRLDPEGIDPYGFERRQAELQTLLEIYRELESKFQGQVPIAVAGDLNGNASRFDTDIEFKPLYQTTQLKDVCELANVALEHTTTFYQVSRSSKPEGKQLDYCFLSPLLAQLLDPSTVQVFRYKDHLGQAFDPPTTLEAKMSLPSDHYPLVFTLRNIPLR
ncbi:MAG: endonuclease/exonuclease/phosphatase family protein [Pseudobdellovibrionaceae bacterium]